LKKAIPILAVLVVVAVLVALLLPRYLNPETYRPRLERAIREATGWETDLGEIKLRLFGGTSIQVRPVELSDPGTDFRTEIGTLRIRVELKPLLKGTLVIRKIEVVKPLITLRWTDDGLQLPSQPRRAGTGTTPRTKGDGEGGGAASPPGGRTGGLAIEVSRVEIRDGNLKILHETREAPSTWTLNQVNGGISPAKGKLSISGRAGQGGISVTTGHGAVTVAMEHLGVEDLPPWLVQDLVQPGGELSGTINMREDGRRIDGELTARNLAFPKGQKALKKVGIGLRIAREGKSWILQDLRLKSSGATLGGSGPLAPRLDLRLELESSPVEAALAMARAMFPLPVEVKGPGRVRATARILRGPRGALTATVSGKISAARLRLMEGVPPIREAQASFRVTRDGHLNVSSIRGTFARGTLGAKLDLAPINPPGALSLGADLEGADLRKLLVAFSVPRAKETSGSASLDVRLNTNLSKGIPEPANLDGTITATVTHVTLPGWDLVSALTDQLGRGGSWRDMLRALSAPEKSKAGDARASFDRARLRILMGELPWKVPNIELDAPELQARGSGSFDPVRGTVAARLECRLAEALSRKLLEKASFLSSLRDTSGRLVVPVTVRGPLADPSISIDLESALAGGEGYGGLLESLLGGRE